MNKGSYANLLFFISLFMAKLHFSSYVRKVRNNHEPKVRTLLFLTYASMFFFSGVVMEHFMTHPIF